MHHASATAAHHHSVNLRTARRRQVSAAAGCAAAFALTAAIVLYDHRLPVGPDAALHRWVVQHRSPDLTAIARVVTSSGGPFAYLVAGAGGFLAATRARAPRWAGALVGAAVLAAGQAVRFALASAIVRPRPPIADRITAASGYAFPSGHSTTTALAAAILCIGLAPLGLGGGLSARVRVAGSAAALAWAFAVGLSRVYRGVHWPTDVLAGWLLAAALTLTAAAALRPRHQPAAA